MECFRSILGKRFDSSSCGESVCQKCFDMTAVPMEGAFVNSVLVDGCVCVCVCARLVSLSSSRRKAT